MGAPRQASCVVVDKDFQWRIALYLVAKKILTISETVAISVEWG